MKKIVYLVFLLLFVSCTTNTEKKGKTSNNKEVKAVFNQDFELKEGDILFQDSDCGPYCESIEKVTFGIHGSKFSHVGMVIRDNDTLKVIEAITAGVVITSLEDFFKRSFDENGNSKVAVGRIKTKHKNLIPQAVAFAKTKLGAPYDPIYEIADENYYCSELIYYSFKNANYNTPIFELQPMTFKDPNTQETFPIWAAYFKDLGIKIPEGKPGLNPGGMSTSNYLEVVNFYGKPQGFEL